MNTKLQEIKLIKKSDGTKIKYVSLNYNQGKKYFLSLGYTVSPNKNFMTTNGVFFVHWNSTMKIWIYG